MLQNINQFYHPTKHILFCVQHPSLGPSGYTINASWMKWMKEESGIYFNDPIRKIKLALSAVFTGRPAKFPFYRRKRKENCQRTNTSRFLNSKAWAQALAVLLLSVPGLFKNTPYLPFFSCNQIPTRFPDTIKKQSAVLALGLFYSTVIWSLWHLLSVSPWQWTPGRNAFPLLYTRLHIAEWPAPTGSGDRGLVPVAWSSGRSPHLQRCEGLLHTSVSALSPRDV